MIFLFVGEEKYLLDTELNKWKGLFIKKYGKDNLYVFGEDNFNIEQIANLLIGGGLFENKKLIIIKGFPKDSFIKIPSNLLEQLENFFIQNIDKFNTDSDNVIVLVSYKPDKRTKFYKFLSKCDKLTIKDFKLLNTKGILDYLVKHYPIQRQDAEYLVELVGTNLYMLCNELSKIIKLNKAITKEIIDKYVVKNTQQDAFKLLDNLGTKEKALKILANLQEIGEDFFKILGLLYWNLKNILLIKEQQDLGKGFKEITSILGLHPFVVNKIYKNSYDLTYIRDLFLKLINLEWQIKKGEISVDLGYLYLKKILID